MTLTMVDENQEVLIIDQFTGRTMPGRRYSDGLHQAIEAKEAVPIQDESKQWLQLPSKTTSVCIKNCQG